MNIHPLLVHFPIALLTLYALLEIISIKKITDRFLWISPVKIFLVITGFLSGFVAYQAGELIEDQFKKITALAPVVEVHSNIASFTLVIFGAIAVSYAVQVANQKGIRSKNGIVLQINKTAVALSKVVLRRGVVFLLATIGLIAVTVTGALGGAIAYGPDIDPFVKIIYSLLFGK